MSNLERHPIFCHECGVQEQDEIDIRVRNRIFGDPMMCDECYAVELKLDAADDKYEESKADRVNMEDWDPWEKGE